MRGEKLHVQDGKPVRIVSVRGSQAMVEHPSGYALREVHVSSLSVAPEQ